MYAAPPPPPPVVVGGDVRPAKRWFLVAALVAVGGIVLAVIIGVVGYRNFEDRIEGFQRIDVPGEGEVTLGTGGYTVYHEYPDAADDSDSSEDLGSDDDIGTPNVSITNPSGDEVRLASYVADVTYATGGHEGVGAFSFDAEEAGVYRVVADGSSGTTVAIGRGIGRGLVTTIVGALVAGFGGVIAGAVIAIVVGVRRSQSRNRLIGQAVGPPVGWGPTPYGAYAPPAGAYGAPGPPPPGGYGAPSGGYGAPAPPAPGGYGAPGAAGPPSPGGPGPAGPPSPGGSGAPAGGYVPPAPPAPGAYGASAPPAPSEVAPAGGYGNSGPPTPGGPGAPAVEGDRRPPADAADVDGPSGDAPGAPPAR